MHKNKRRPRIPEVTAPAGGLFSEVVRAVQERWIVPHCATCRRPCCGLDTLVLEFTWLQFRLLWGIRTPRGEFDARLARGGGPQEVRTQDGRYYVHGKPCPAYRDARCGVYETDLKPGGCSDFPLYVDDRGVLIADLRCEALSLQQVEAELRSRRPPGARELRRRINREFPFLVSFLPGPPGADSGRGPRTRPGPA